MNWAILLTGSGAAAIAVVRIGGEGVEEFLSRHLSRAAAPGRAVHGTLSDGDCVIDDPVVVLHEGGGVADINLHGGPWVVRRFLELAKKSGFKVIAGDALPLADQAVDGETEIERQVQRLLPLARTELALRWLSAQPGAWRRFPRRAGGGEFPRWLLFAPRVAIVGAANAGKSTLANQLFGRERSITADEPGTTRDWVGEIADINGLAVFLMDTPGLRQSSDAIEEAAIAAARGPIAEADMVVLVLDATETPEGQQGWVRRYPSALVVRNKCDRAGDAAAIDAGWPHVCTVGISGLGIGALRGAIVRRFIRPWRHPRRAVIRGLCGG